MSYFVLFVANKYYYAYAYAYAYLV